MLRGKVVNIENPELLQFFYPEFQIKDNLSFQDKDRKIIYIGRVRNKIKEYLNRKTKSYISTVGRVDIDLEEDDKLLEIVYKMKDRKLYKKVKKSIEMLDREELVYALKVFWITGDWIYDYEEDDLTMYNLFKGTTSSMKELLQIYFQLLGKYPFYMIESSFITFLQRTLDIEDQDISPVYRRLLKSFNSKSGDKLKNSMMKYVQKSSLREELRFLDLLINLR